MNNNQQNQNRNNQNQNRQQTNVGTDKELVKDFNETTSVNDTHPPVPAEDIPTEKSESVSVTPKNAPVPPSVEEFDEIVLNVLDEKGPGDDLVPIIPRENQMRVRIMSSSGKKWWSFVKGQEQFVPRDIYEWLRDSKSAVL